jgi:ATP-dependent Clp protease ATP-binding subunit ClpA
LKSCSLRRSAGPRQHAHPTSSTCCTRSCTTRTANGFARPAAPVAGLAQALATYLDESVERHKRGGEREPEQTMAFRRVLQAAVMHVQSAGRDEANAGDVFAAILQQPKSHAAQLLAAQGITRLDILNYISHGISKMGAGGLGASVPRTARPTRPPARRRRPTR